MRSPVLFAALLALGSAPALAGPFAEVGDRQLRQDVDLLHAAGLIEGPVDSWPLPWAQIDAGLNKAHDGRELDPYLKSAVNRLDRLGDLAAQRVALDVRISGTNQVSVARDFGTLARGQFDGSGRVEFNSDTVSVALGAGLRSGNGQQGDNTYYHFEPSQVAIRLGNWALYGGYTEQWFGPGHDGALLWSNSARPIPKIGLKRLNPDPVNFPVLRWLGPMQFEIFGGLLDGPRADFRNILTFGTRLSFAPARGLQIGLNRAQMLCGDGRPCGLKQIVNSFIGIGNSDNPTTGDPNAFFNQAGNQIAGFDISYVQRFGPVSAKFYAEAEAEDFDNVILEQFTRMIGTTVSGPLGKRGASWVATLEYSDTYAVSLFNGTPLEGVTGGETRYPGSAYNNSLYTDGFTYRGRPIGYWTDGDSRNLSFSAAVTDTRNRRWYGSVRSVHINVTDLGNPPRAIFPRPDGTPGPEISYRVSANSEKFAIVTGGAELP
ncbi:MAG: capsule assembly Wzi family protein, partial [Polymorphobacter sp.]